MAEASSTAESQSRVIAVSLTVNKRYSGAMMVDQLRIKRRETFTRGRNWRNLVTHVGLGKRMMAFTFVERDRMLVKCPCCSRKSRSNLPN